VSAMSDIVERTCVLDDCVRPHYGHGLCSMHYQRERRRKKEPVGPLNAVKTACPKGHPYDDENTLVSNGRRCCRICKAESGRASLKRQRRWEKGKSGPNAAHTAVMHAIEKGVLLKPLACPSCGRQGRLHFHHTQGYEPANYFVGEWLCPRCHVGVHRRG
jgi:hypothetical protein